MMPVPPVAAWPQAAAPLGEGGSIGKTLLALARQLPGQNVARLPVEEVAQVLAVARKQVALAQQLAAFDLFCQHVQLFGPALAHYDAVLAFLEALAPSRLAAIEARLAAAGDAAATRAASLQTARNLCQPIFPRFVQTTAQQLLARQGVHLRLADVIVKTTCVAAGTREMPDPTPALAPVSSHAQAQASGPEAQALPVLTSDTLAIVGRHLALEPVYKNKVTPQHALANAISGSWRPLSTFIPPGRPDFAGVVSPTLQMGSFCKLRLLLRWDNKAFALRQGSTLPQRQIAPTRLFADGASEPNCRLLPIDPARYLDERRGQQAADSPFAPRASFFDRKQRLWDVLPLFDGDVHGLCEGFGDEMPAAVLLKCALGVLPTLAKLENMGWLHNDVKPENILWRTSGEVALADFGLCGPLGATGRLGTPGYLCPQAAISQRGPSPHGDLYALAMTLAHLLQPWDFADFPLTVSFDRKAIDLITRRKSLRAAGKAAERNYFAWRNWHDTGFAPTASANTAVNKAVLRIEGCFRAAERRSPLLAELMFMHWAHPHDAERGTAQDHLAALLTEHPPEAPLWRTLAPTLKEAGARDGNRLRIAQTLDVMARFRADYLALVQQKPPAS